MVLFLKKLLRLCRPYRQRLVLGVAMGLVGGALEALLMLSVKLAIDVAFPGANTLSANTPTFTANSIENRAAFVAQLREPTNHVSQYLVSHFSPSTLEQISNFNPTNSSSSLSDSLADELNLTLHDPKLYSPQLFPDQILNRDARLVLAQKPTADNLAKRNRILLESAYPGMLANARLPFLDLHPRLREQLDGFTKWLPDMQSNRTLSVAFVIIIIPLMMLLRGAVSYLNVYFLQWVAVRAITDLRTKLFAHLMNLPLAFMNKLSTGELISRVMGDTVSVQNAISNSLVVIIKDPATLIGLIALLLWQQPMLTLVSLIVFPICLVPIIIYARKVRQSSKAIQNHYAELARIIHESFTGNRIIKAYNLERNVVTQFRDASGRFIGHYMRSVRAGEMPGPLIEFFGAIGIACLFYYIMVVSRTIDVGSFVMFVGSVFSMYKPVKSLSRLYSQLEQANASSQRVFELLDTVSTLPEPKQPLQLKAANAEIQFDSINFNYEAKPILHEFSLTVKPGQMVAAKPRLRTCYCDFTIRSLVRCASAA
jgi:ABC-type multidrug transport system fused ATPase/permease subunit